VKPHRKSIVIACVAGLLAAAPAHALRVATWNVLNYDDNISGNTITLRQGQFRTVLAAMDPDVIVLQEMKSSGAADSFATNVLNAVEPGQWSGGHSSFILSAESAVFWKSAAVSVGALTSVATGGPRTVLKCWVKPVGYLNKAAWFRLFSMHLKATSVASDSATRTAECTSLRNSLNTDPFIPNFGSNFLLGGDTNFNGAYEAGYVRLTESQSDNDGRSQDYQGPLPGEWKNNSSYAIYDTQCPCGSCRTDLGTNFFSGGGMDDRFDLMFTSYPVQDGSGLDVVQYVVYGQDGLHFNTDINGGNFNAVVPLAVATALHDASDHLPVYVVLQLPAKLSAASQLDFGSVIVGATAQQSLAIADIAPTPGETLNYSFTAPAGFTAPSGTLTQSAGAPATDQTIGMGTASAGARQGTLTIASNDPDTSSKNVLLSGRVLRHAVASLESLSVVLADTLDFGDQPADAFTDGVVRLYDQAYDPLQARLSVNSGGIVGGDDRFSIVGGFSGSLVAGSPASYQIHFDATGATVGSTYYATLTLSSADEALPGAQAQPDVVVTLRARPTTPGAGVPGELPAVLRFYPPRPNPAAGPVSFAFDLPKAAPVQLDVFDLSGRRVASVASGELGAGRHELRWSPRAAGQGAGLYFARFSTPGLARTTRFAVLP
jgi:endonuclease/exonuclease/phosphatase family metal-dependent hydrolase